jgi:hypothetical protein
MFFYKAPCRKRAANRGVNILLFLNVFWFCHGSEEIGSKT